MGGWDTLAVSGRRWYGSGLQKNNEVGSIAARFSAQEMACMGWPRARSAQRDDGQTKHRRTPDGGFAVLQSVFLHATHISSSYYIYINYDYKY